ncbi:DUF3570 domain-containing protein [Methylomonas sp. HW2-6]|uniref:DUF3570 domain-containing protein n=1 Tax=Methylomonas sp. HW2-6 TaxID=3376687 RepID=UPI00404167E7
MAVTKPPIGALQALSAAALLLPGLAQRPVQAAELESVDFQYGHYQEGNRAVYGQGSDPVTSQKFVAKAPNYLNPIEADSLRGSARIAFSDRLKFAFNYTQDTWSGATPIATAPAITGNSALKYDPTYTTITGASPLLSGGAAFYADRNGRLYEVATTGEFDPDTGSPIFAPGAPADRLTHVMVGASPELRQQGDFKLSYDWDEAAASLGGGTSVENDYESRFANLGLRLDFNQKRTSLNFGASYTNSATQATLDPLSQGYFSQGPAYNDLAQLSTDYNAAGEAIAEHWNSRVTGARIDKEYDIIVNRNGVHIPSLRSTTLRGNRQDWGAELGLSQVLTPHAVLALDMSYTRSDGFLGNPYKAVYAYNALVTPGQDLNQPLLYSARGSGIYEARPIVRNQFNWHVGYSQFVEPLDAALHFNYRFGHDDWGIDAHTFDADWVQPLGMGWTITPTLRYYSQSAAEFYAPYFTTITETATDPDTGETTYRPIKALPKHYSSDQRLSGYGALSGGVVVAKQFARGLKLQVGFEYYSHRGSLKLGGGGEQDFADYDYWSANAALSVNFAQLGRGSGAGDGHRHGGHAGAAAPAGVMFAHTLNQAGDWMLGYRYQRSEQAGAMLHGDRAVGQADIAANGCEGATCAMAPAYMAMNMHMLELMYAPSDWLTLMLMPQWMDMAMDMTMLVDERDGNGHSHASKMINTHQTGGIGDTGLYALFKVLAFDRQQLVLSLGGSAPTGDVNWVWRRNSPASSTGETPMDYGMQTGSGTWDFKPSLTYSGAWQDWLWGAQAGGTLRLQHHNEAKYALGDVFQGSVWGGYQLTDWLSGSVRGIYSWQDKLRGHYPNNSLGQPYSGHDGTFDKTSNYGGQFVDLGLGLNVQFRDGALAGHGLKLEWLQPLYTKFNGYQLDRDYTLNANWSYDF